MFIINIYIAFQLLLSQYSKFHLWNTDLITIETTTGSEQQEFVSVLKYGAVGDGKKDETLSIQKAINENKSIFIPKGRYKIDAVKMINIPSNREITWAEGAIFEVIPNNRSHYRVLNIARVNNIVLNSPQIIGDRYDHKSKVGEHGHGIVISGGYNVKIFNAKISDCWGDGMAIYSGESIIVDNLFSNRNRRMGLTITSGKNLYIKNPVCSNIDGISPMAGIDIEPNYSQDRLININLINPITKNNNGPGISVSQSKLINSNQKVTIYIDNHQDFDSSTGFYVGKLGRGSKRLDGEIVNRNARYINSKTNGIFIENYSSENTPTIKIINPHILNANTSNQNSARWGSGIVFLRESSAKEKGKLGNILINNAEIIDNRKNPKMRSAFHFNDDKKDTFSKSFILGKPIIKGIPSNRFYFIPIQGVQIKE